MKTENQESLWNPINEAAERQSFQFRFPPNETIPEVPSVRDWVAKRVIQGYPAAFLLALSAIVAGVYGFEPSVLACAPAWALLLTFLFRPLTRSRSGGVSYGGIALFGLTAILLTPILNLSSTVILQQVQYGFLQSELPAIYLQASLEQLFSPGSLLLLLVLGGIVVAGLAVYEHRYFWLQERPEGALGTYLPLLLPITLLAGLAVLSSVASKEPPPEQLSWLDQMEPKLESRPFGDLPENGDDNYWRDQAGLLRGNDNFRATLDLQDHKPTSVKELNAYAYYLQRSAESGRRPLEMLKDLRLQCRAIPYVNLDINFGFLSKQLQAAPADQPTLQLFADQLETIRREIPTSDETFDLVAYRQLRKKKYHGTFSMGSWSTYQLKRHEREHEPFEVRPLNLLGYSFSPSPTELLYGYQRNRLLSEWLELRATGLPDDALQRDQILRRRQEAYNDSTMGRSFWYELAYQDQVDSFRASVEGLAVIVAIRRYQARTGSLPPSLDGLVAHPEKYDWQLKDGQGTLRDKMDWGGYVPASPVRFGGAE